MSIRLRGCANRRWREIWFPGARDRGRAPRTAGSAPGGLVTEDRRSSAARSGAWGPKIRQRLFAQPLNAVPAPALLGHEGAKEEPAPQGEETQGGEAGRPAGRCDQDSEGDG